MSLTAVTDATFEEEVKNASVPVLVDFWAEWCGPCQMLTPVLEQVAEEKGDEAKIVKVNIDDNPELKVKFDVRAIPMLVFFKDGEVVDSFSGVKSKDVIASKLDELAL